MADTNFRNTVAQGLTTLYKKLASAAYVSPAFIQNPPPRGWTDAQLDMSGLLGGKTDAVIELIRHLPFLQPVDGAHWPIHPKTLAVSYLLPPDDLTVTEGELLSRLPPHVISLSRGGLGGWSLYGPTWWLVDCEAERIRVYIGDPAALADRWRACSSLDPGEVFEDAESKLDRSYLPVPAVHGVKPDVWARDHPDREFDAVAEIYRNHGWPATDGHEFRRCSCRAKLKALMAKKREWEQRKPAMESARRDFQQQYPQFQPASLSSPLAPGYNRDAIVAGITRYYETLAKMAWFSPKLIQYPPPGGWGDRDFLPADKLRLLRFNDRVVDLLRHIPYIDMDEESDEVQWPVYLDNSIPERYLRDNPQLNDDLTEDQATPDNLAANSIFPWHQPTPSGLVPLSGGRYATWWALDTNTGDMILFDRMKEVPGAPDDQPWLWRRPRPAVQFFDTLCSKLMSLDLVPVPRHDIEEAPSIWGGISDDWEENGGLFDLVIEDARDIYRAHGWPDVDSFEREECYEALAELHERYCDEAVHVGEMPEDSSDE